MQIDPDKLRRGDAATCNAVYDAHLPTVLRMLHRGFVYTVQGERRFFRVASAFDREELCQEAFCEFFRQCQAGRFDTQRPIGPYLRRIVVNLALKSVRRQYREVMHIEPVDQVEDFNVAAAMQQNEVMALIQTFRTDLPEDDRVLLDTYAEVASQRVVGERLGLSRDQVYRRLARIRGAARRFLKKKGWLDDA